MTLKRKATPKQKQDAKDGAETKKFLIIVAIATMALMVLMYLIFS